MAALRSFLRRHRWFAAWLLLASLCLKALTPPGYMVSSQGQVLTVSICADATGEHLTRAIVIPAKGEPGRGQDAGDACPFSALTMGAIAGADIVLLSLALAFILALGFGPQALPELHGERRIRPPLRGPPAAA